MQPGDESLRAHPQGLANQLLNLNSATPFEVGLTGFERDHVRVCDAQLRHVFDGEDALLMICEREQRREQGGLSTPRRTGDEHVFLGHHEVAELLRCRFITQSSRDQIGKTRMVRSGNTDRDECAAGAHRCEHDVYPNAALESHVDARCELVNVTTPECDEGHGKVSEVVWVEHPLWLSRGAATAVDPELI